MLRHALRRILWTIPTLIGVSFVTFLFLSYVPDATDDPKIAAELGPARVATIRRERFVDLPRFVNPAPRDVRARADEAVRVIAAGGEDADAARAELVRLGGAALPHVLAELDALPPEPRTRVALALAPIARRMGVAQAGDAEDPARSVAFWTRFWADRGVEFRDSSVRSAVRRLDRYGTASRAAELRELDTFALDHVLGALEAPRDGSAAMREREIDRARALIDVAAHVTGRDDRIAVGDDVAAAAACASRWRKFWTVYRADFVVSSGLARVAAVVLETRYGKWALEAATLGFGVGHDGVPVVDKVAARAPVTLVIVFGAILLAYGVAVPLGALSAAARGRRLDLAIACGVLGLYAAPTAVVAVLVARAAGAGAFALFAPILVLSLALIAAPAREQRSALLSVLSQDFVRAAVARGSGRARTVIVHGLRNALLPIVTLAALEPPMALGGAFVVERVFGLDGLGEATIRAVQMRDTPWLMALSIFAAAIAAFLVILTDLSYVILDPRLSRAITLRKRRR